MLSSLKGNRCFPQLPHQRHDCPDSPAGWAEPWRAIVATARPIPNYTGV